MTKKPVADRYDWWVVPIDGGPPVPTGALALLRNKGVFPVWREPADWLGDTVLFAASTAQYAGILSTGAVNQSSIWSVRLERDPWRVQGDPQQLTVASAVEAQPSMALADTSTGLVALANTPGNMEIWTLPVRGNEGEVTGEMKRLTTTVVENTYPSLSVDGNRLVFASDRHRNTDIFALDLRTGTETALTTTDFNEFSPFLSADNSNVLYYDYRPDQKPSFTFWVASAAGGTPRKVCADCDGPLYGWSANAKRVVYGDLPTGKGRVRVRYVDSGRDDVLVEHPKYAIRFPRVSPDERWILFQTVISQTQRQIFAAPLGGWRAAPESSWIPITNGRTPDRNAVWSPNGSLVYFLSERDGFRCFWAQTLDPTTKRPRGEPLAVQHFHEARRRFSPDDFVGLTLTVGPDKIAFPMRERTGNIWLATLETR
jgi:eukaryotic-like serine/threonine-protein kinase